MRRLLIFACGTLVAASAAWALVDANHNQMSDLWEKEFNNGQLLSEIDPQGDADGDGKLNKDEAIAGTDPFSGIPPEGFLQPNIIHTPAVWDDLDGDEIPDLIIPETITVSWPTVSGKQYTLLYSPDLSSGSWQAVEAPFVANGEIPEFVFTLPGADKLFYRVGVNDIDQDGDGFTNYEEWLANTDPYEADRDADGLPDWWEDYYGLDSNDDGSVDPANGPNGDPDGEGLFNREEYFWDVDPYDTDTDDDLLDDRTEVFIYGTLPNHSDTDWDSLDDYEEIMVYHTDPLNEDTDGDTLQDDTEIQLHGTNPLKSDSDEDTLRDDWELLHGFDPLLASGDNGGNGDPDGDSLTNYWEMMLRLDPLSADTNGNGISDGNDDNDKDGLSNLVEVTIHHTDPTRFDSDGDGMPDPWEIQFALNPMSADGLDGTHGDADNDSLPNFGEWLYGTNPHNPDSDGDGTPDGTEVSQGSDPNSPGDGGIPPPPDEMEGVPFSVSDPSGSHSEKWKMTIRGLGPKDTRTFSLASPDFGERAFITFKLRKGNCYEVSVSHLGTDPEYLEEYDEADYDWEATADGKPGGVAQGQTSSQPSANTFFVVKDHWLIDNRQSVLTTEKHGNSEDIVTGKKAFLIPVAIKDNIEATGVDAESITANKSDAGYQSKYWLMAPIGTDPVGNDCENAMHFKIPLNPAADLIIVSDNATADPDTTSLSTADPGPSVSWHGTAADSLDDETTQWKIGPAAEKVELPINVKVMKKRTVKVAVHKIASVVPGRADDSPDLMPTEAAIEAKLNEVFGSQINAWFDATMLPQENLAFDVADGNSYPGFTFPFPPVPGDRALNHKSFAWPETSLATVNRSEDYDIHVYVIGGATPIYTYKLDESGTYLLVDELAKGLANLEEGMNYCIIDGDRNGTGANGNFLFNPDERTVQDVVDTIAHEIGHIIVGDGHPDEGGGVAPLQGTDRTKRLMCSGGSSGPDSKLLVKAEWDKAEVNLKKIVEHQND